MTSLQKEILTYLLKDHIIVKYPSLNGGRRYRIRDREGRPVRNITDCTFGIIKEYLRKEKAHFVVDKRKLRSLRKNHTAKKLYNSVK